MEKVIRNKKQWVDTVTQAILADLDTAIHAYGRAHILLSGGSTPGPVYEALNESCSFLTKTKIGLVDERFVPLSSKFSNERLLRESLNCLKETPQLIIPMVFDPLNEQASLASAEEAYEPFLQRTDIVVLGMGGDGHTASIFPGDEASEEAMEGPSRLVSTKAPAEPTRRVTCSLSTIVNAKKIYVLISGKQKWDVIQNTSLNLPIHAVLKRRSDTKIYYFEENEYENT